MTRRTTTAAVAAGVLALALTGCSAQTAPPGDPPATGGRPMMSGGGPMMPGTATGIDTCAPPELPGQSVTVVLADMDGMMSSPAGAPAPASAPPGVRMMLRAVPAGGPAGQVRIVARNRGVRPHEVVVLPLDGRPAPGLLVPGADGTVDESGALGEVSSTCGATGEGDGVAAGQTGWTTLTLAPGRYELLCNLPNHYADGMWADLDIE